MPERKIVAASAVLAPFALAAIFLFPDSKSPSISPSQVYTWDCEYPAQKPVAITLTCADGGMYLDQIDWSRWDSKGAQEIGIYNMSNCGSSCSEEICSNGPVKVHLSSLAEQIGKREG